MRVHLDTDFGGDTDDACALAYLLGSADVELVGVTTVADADGRRAAYARYLSRPGRAAGPAGHRDRRPRVRRPLAGHDRVPHQNLTPAMSYNVRRCET